MILHAVRELTPIGDADRGVGPDGPVEAEFDDGGILGNRDAGDGEGRGAGGIWAPVAGE